MDFMDKNDVSLLGKHITGILKEEYSFYQSLYILLDRQKDMLKYSNENKLLEIFSDIERCYLRIKKSQDKIDSIKEKNPQMFKLAVLSPTVRKIFNSISTLIKKCQNIVIENEEYVKNRYERIQNEMDLLKNSEKILKYIQSDNLSTELVDNH